MDWFLRLVYLLPIRFRFLGISVTIALIFTGVMISINGFDEPTLVLVYLVLNTIFLTLGLVSARFEAVGELFRKCDTFLAAPSAVLKNDAAREAWAQDLRAVVTALKKSTKCRKIHCQAIERTEVSSFSIPRLALSDNFTAMGDAQRFIAIINQWGSPVPTSALLEIGIAIGMRKSVLIFIQEDLGTPYILQGIASHQLDPTTPLIIVPYKNIETLKHYIHTHKDKIFT